MSNMLFDIPQPEKAISNPTPELANKPFKHSVVDSKKTPIETIASYIGGSNFLNTYYSQQFTESEELKPFDPSQLNVYQQYHKINDFIIKLQGALSGSDESSDTGRYALTGTAIIPPLPNLKPNNGDVLIADIGEGQAGQFSVTSVRKMSHNLAAAWEIEFSLERIADEKLVNLLDMKVTTESWYQKDYLITGQNPLLKTEDYQAGQNLETYFQSIARQFVTNNFSIQVRTLTVPLQDLITYDPFVTRAMNRLITEQDVPMMRSITLFNCDDYRISSYPDIYSAVISRDPTAIYSVFKEFRGINTWEMRTLGFQNPIRLSGVKRLVVPYTEQLDNDNYKGLNQFLDRVTNPLNPGILLDGTSVYGLDSCGCKNTYNPHYIQKEKERQQSMVGNPGMLIPTITNESYVLSKEFYTKELVKCSRFERDVWDILDGKPINRQHIYAYCEAYPKWGRLEQFYLTPFLLAMIKYAISGI